MMNKGCLCWHEAKAIDECWVAWCMDISEREIENGTSELGRKSFIRKNVTLDRWCLICLVIQSCVLSR